MDFDTEDQVLSYLILIDKNVRGEGLPKPPPPSPVGLNNKWYRHHYHYKLSYGGKSKVLGSSILQVEFLMRWVRWSGGVRLFSFQAQLQWYFPKLLTSTASFLHNPVWTCCCINGKAVIKHRYQRVPLPFPQLLFVFFICKPATHTPIILHGEILFMVCKDKWPWNRLK